MNERIKIILADDHELVIEGIAKIIREQPDLELVGTTDNGSKLVSLLATHRPDIVITDIQMPVMNGIEATSAIQKRFPDTAVIALSMFDNEYIIKDMLQAGAVGYINKSAKPEEILKAIYAAYKGEHYHCRSTSNKITSMITARIFDPNDPGVSIFTESEFRMIRLFCEGLDLPEIAKKMGVAYGTAKRYRVEIFEKAGVDSTVKLVLYAKGMGMCRSNE